MVVDDKQTDVSKRSEMPFFKISQLNETWGRSGRISGFRWAQYLFDPVLLPTPCCCCNHRRATANAIEYYDQGNPQRPYAGFREPYNDNPPEHPSVAEGLLWGIV